MSYRCSRGNKGYPQTLIALTEIEIKVTLSLLDNKMNFVIPHEKVIL